MVGRREDANSHRRHCAADTPTPRCSPCPTHTQLCLKGAGITSLVCDRCLNRASTSTRPPFSAAPRLGRRPAHHSTQMPCTPNKPMSASFRNMRVIFTSRTPIPSAAQAVPPSTNSRTDRHSPSSYRAHAKCHHQQAHQQSPSEAPRRKPSPLPIVSRSPCRGGVAHRRRPPAMDLRNTVWKRACSSVGGKQGG